MWTGATQWVCLPTPMITFPRKLLTICNYNSTMDCIDVLLSMHEGNAFWYHRGKLNTEGWDQDVVMECSTYHLTFMSSSCNSDTCPNCHITRHTSDFTPSAHSFHHQFFELHLQIPYFKAIVTWCSVSPHTQVHSLTYCHLQASSPARWLLGSWLRDLLPQAVYQPAGNVDWMETG